MSTGKIKSRTRGANVSVLTEQMQVFIAELLADPKFNLTKAAEKAGYAHPSVAGAKLIKHPTVQAALGKAKHAREQRTELKSDEVANVIARAIYVDWTKLFKYGPDGWFITKRDFANLPEEYGMLIEEIKEVKSKEWDPKLKKFRYKTILVVTPVSKTVMIGLAAKHTMVEEHVHKHAHFNFDSLIQQAIQPPVDKVEQRLIEAEVINEKR